MGINLAPGMLTTFFIRASKPGIPRDNSPPQGLKHNRILSCLDLLRPSLSVSAGSVFPCPGCNAYECQSLSLVRKLVLSAQFLIEMERSTDLMSERGEPLNCMSLLILDWVCCGYSYGFAVDITTSMSALFDTSITPSNPRR